MDNNKTLTKIIEDQAGELETMRVLQLKLAKTIDSSASGRDIAALSRQLQTVTARIRELEELEIQSDNVLEQIIAKHKGQTVRSPKGRRNNNDEEE